MTGHTEIHSLWKSLGASGLEGGVGGWASAYVPSINDAYTNELPTADFSMTAHPIVDCGLMAS